MAAADAWAACSSFLASSATFSAAAARCWWGRRGGGCVQGRAELALGCCCLGLQRLVGNCCRLQHCHLSSRKPFRTVKCIPMSWQTAETHAERVFAQPKHQRFHHLLKELVTLALNIA